MAGDAEDHAGRLRAAARWYAELKEPDLSPESFEAFQAWEANPANAAAFREIERSLVVMDRTGFGRRKGRGGGAPGLAGRWRAGAVWLSGVAAVLVLGVAGLLWWPSGPEAPAVLRYASGVGEIREVSLSDGSVVTLNTGTSLTVRFDEARRVVDLARGQALFEVAADGRDFVVEAGGRRTRALGTVFDVRTLDSGVTVTLVEGSVSVSGAGEARVLSAGEQLVASAAGVEVRAVDTESLMAWKRGMVAFDDVTLAEAVAEMNRYSAIEIRLGDAGLADERISGRFPAGQPVEFAESLELFLPVRAERDGETITLWVVGE